MVKLMEENSRKKKKDLIASRIYFLFQTGFFHIFGSSVVNKLISFMSTIVLVHILTKSEYGTFTYSWNIYGIIMLFNGLALESAVLQVCCEHAGDTDYSIRISGFCMRTGLTYDLFISVVIVVIAFFVPLKIEGARVVLFYTVLLPEISLILNISISYLRTQKRNLFYSGITLFNTFLLFICQSGGTLLFREKGIIWGYYISGIITFFVLFFVSSDVRCILKNIKTRSVDGCKALFSIGAVSMINNGIAQMMYLLDVFVLGFVTSNGAVLAGYKVATVIPTALTFIPASFVTYIYPYFAEHRMDGKWCLVQYKKILKYIGLMNLVISMTLILLASRIVPFVFGRQYDDPETIAIFRLLSFNYFFSGTFRTIAGNLLVTQRKLKFNTFVAIVSGFLNVIGDFFFINIFGARGAAYVTLCVVFISSIMNVCYLIHVFRERSSASISQSDRTC